MNIFETLTRKYPGAQWTLVGSEYEGLEWLDSSPKPTKAQLEAAWANLQETIAQQEQAKVAARESALAKLAALGLTEEEIAAL
jgi:DNA-binding NarL/FixJ family response regulator